MTCGRSRDREKKGSPKQVIEEAGRSFRLSEAGAAGTDKRFFRREVMQIGCLLPTA